MNAPAKLKKLHLSVKIMNVMFAVRSNVFFLSFNEKNT